MLRHEEAKTIIFADELVKRLGKPILHYDTEFGKSILFAKRS